MEKKIPQYQFLTTVLYYIYIICFLYTLNLKKLVFIKKTGISSASHYIQRTTFIPLYHFYAVLCL